MVHHYWLVLLVGILFTVHCFMAPCALISHHGYYFNLFVSKGFFFFLPDTLLFGYFCQQQSSSIWWAVRLFPVNRTTQQMYIMQINVT